MICSFDRRPWPRQSRHGLGISSPVPRQVVQVLEVITVPNTLCLTLETWPEPRHMVHVVGSVPGSAPRPLHRSHFSRLSTTISFCVPNTASSKVSSSISLWSLPRPVRLLGWGPPRPKGEAPPKKASKMPLRSPKLNMSGVNPSPPNMS
jgi:hypothetical protein